MGLPFYPPRRCPDKSHVIGPQADGRHASLPLPRTFNGREKDSPTLRRWWLYPSFSSSRERGADYPIYPLTCVSVASA